MTSKELGMAVAEKLRQSEKRQERGGETPPKQQAPMRRALQPPAPRERADSQAQPTVSGPATQKILDEYKPGDWKNPEKSIWRSREATDEFYAKAYGLPPMTDEEWKAFQRIETMSLAELVRKFGIPSFPDGLPDSPDSKTAKQGTLRQIIRGVLVGILPSAVFSPNDKPAEKK